MIRECALKYKKLTKYYCKITICKNLLYHNLFINFHESDFVHLAGIHKLKDMNHLIRGSKSNVFNKILTDELLCEKLEDSNYYQDIKTRLELCNSLTDILKGKFSLYSYKKNASNFSKIEADYVLRFYYKRKQCYLFLKNRDGAYHVCNSLICDNRNMVLFNNQYKVCERTLRLNKNEQTEELSHAMVND